MIWDPQLKEIFKNPGPSPAQKTPRDLFYGSLDTLLQGTKMLGVRGLNLERHVARFIEIRLVNRSLSWAERKDPYEG